MPRLSHIQTNCTAGELSPRLIGRVDIAKYQNGLKKCYNAVVMVHGGAKRRGGLRYCAGAKNNDKQTRLVPFIFNRDQAFIIELGDGYARFFTAAGAQITSVGSPVEITSPYLEANLDGVHYVQGADTMFMFHESYPTRKLVRYSNTSWKLSVASWAVPPTDEKGDKPATTLTLSAATVGAGRTATAGAASFEASDVGRQITSGAGLATITGYTSTTVVTVTIVDAFASVGPIASGSWTLTESPKTKLTPSVKDPEGAAITLTATAAAFKNSAQVTDIGKFVEINDGLVEITGFTSATIVTGIIRTVLSTTTAAESEGWAMRAQVWNATDGYPRCGTLYEQRLLVSGSPGYPQTIWGTRTGIYDNFADGIADDDGFAFTISSDQVNPIEHLASTRILLPLTYGGEFSMTGGVEKPLTPTNVQIKSQTVYGCDIVRPVRVGNEIIFVQRGGTKVRAIGYRAEIDSFNAPDISILSEHITEGGIIEMAYAQEPDQVIWMVRSDGHAVTLSIDRDQDVVGFAEQETDGLFESFASVPYQGNDRVFAVVVRTIGGATKRFIEYFDDTLNTDSAITGTSGTPTATWTGFDHLNGETIDVLADGVVMPQLTVSGGQITLPRTALAIEGGLHYETEIDPLTPAIQGLSGFGQGDAMSVHEIIVRLHESIGCEVGGQTIPFRQFGTGILDNPVEPFTGDKRVSHLGWMKGEIDSLIAQRQPLPLQVLAIVFKITVNQG